MLGGRSKLSGAEGVGPSGERMVVAVDGSEVRNCAIDLEPWDEGRSVDSILDGVEMDGLWGRWV